MVVLVGKWGSLGEAAMPKRNNNNRAWAMGWMGTRPMVRWGGVDPVLWIGRGGTVPGQLQLLLWIDIQYSGIYTTTNTPI